MSLERRWRRRERKRYWVRERSVWRMERVKLALLLPVLLGLVAAGEEVRSSIVEICPGGYVSLYTCRGGCG